MSPFNPMTKSHLSPVGGQTVTGLSGKHKGDPAGASQPQLVRGRVPSNARVPE